MGSINLNHFENIINTTTMLLETNQHYLTYLCINNKVETIPQHLWRKIININSKYENIPLKQVAVDNQFNLLIDETHLLQSSILFRKTENLIFCYEKFAPNDNFDNNIINYIDCENEYMKSCSLCYNRNCVLINGICKFCNNIYKSLKDELSIYHINDNKIHDSLKFFTNRTMQLLTGFIDINSTLNFLENDVIWYIVSLYFKLIYPDMCIQFIDYSTHGNIAYIKSFLRYFSIYDLKTQIEHHSILFAKNQKLTYNNIELFNHMLIKECNITEGAIAQVTFQK